MTEEKRDDFDAAFEEVAHLAERAPEQVAADAKAAEVAAVAAAAAAETPEAKATREAAEKVAADEAARVAAEAAAAAETPEAKVAREAAEKVAADASAKAAADAEAKAKADVAAAQAAEAARKAAEAETPETKAARAAFEESIKPYEPTEAEKAALTTFEKEFPNEYAAMQARLKGVDRDINKRVHEALSNAMKEVAPRLAAVEATVVTDSAERHFAALKQAHPDYDAVIVKVPEWIKTLPVYAKAGAQAVYDSGTTQEVLALVSDYKKAAGITAVDAGAGAAAQAAAKAVADAAAKAKADADAGLPVSSRRSTAQPAGKKDPNDYDGAFAEVAAAFEAGKAAK